MSKRSGRRKTRQQHDLEAAELRREAHARLINERTGDLRYAQRTRTATGDQITITGDATADLKAMLEDLAVAFRAKFGRDPGPNDPVFFDMDADEPRPMTEDAIEKAHQDTYEALIEAAQHSDPTMIPHFRAAQDVGYLVTKQNMHLLSVAEIDAYWDAYDRHAAAA